MPGPNHSGDQVPCSGGTEMPPAFSERATTSQPVSAGTVMATSDEQQRDEESETGPG